MGRRPVHSGYQVKNTFVELTPAEAVDQDAEFSRGGTRAMSANDADTYVHAALQVPQDDKFMAQTPSPFLHPAHAPNMNELMNLPPLSGYEMLDGSMPTVFGEIPADADYCLNGFSIDEDQTNYSQGMMYDPSSGMYMAHGYQDWQMPYSQGCYPMMGDNYQQGIAEFDQMGMQMQQSSGDNHAEHLLAALSEKLAAEKGAQDGSNLYGGHTPYGDSAMIESMGGPCDLLPGQEAYMDPCLEIFPAMDLQGVNGMSTSGHMDHGQHGERSGRKNRIRDRGERSERGHGDVSGETQMQGNEVYNGPCNFTTVMFRNIPNKYTREMLVQQLETDLKGMFDFVYLPIDFKNKCNVGYAFINFRTTEACDHFLRDFNGVEVRKCLPGLNSRKVTEVTPARVQGFEENVQRLRNSPVMRELAQHQEWMPLIFDLQGEQTPFPMPERPLEPIKPRRRGREDRDRD